MVTGETSQAYNEVITFNLVSVRGEGEPVKVSHDRRGDLTGLQ